MFPPAQQALVRSQLSSVLQGIVTQVLLPRESGTGRIAAREILLATPAVRTMIREGNTHQLYNSLTGGIKEGMCPLELSLAAKVRQNLITKEVGESEANRPSMFRDYLAASALSLDVPGLAVADPEEMERRKEPAL